MTDNLFVHMLKSPDLSTASHLVVDVLFWHKQYRILSEANYKHGKYIGKVVDRTTRYVESMTKLGPVGPVEQSFFRELDLVNDTLRQQKDSLDVDMKAYCQMDAILKGFRDDKALQVDKFDQQYTVARTKLDEQFKLVENRKKTYHKTMLKIEKAKIKLQLASTPEVIMETKKKVDDLNTKVESQLEKYKLHLDKWKTKWERAEEVSKELETDYLAREEARSICFLVNLQNSLDLTSAGNFAHRNLGFGHIKGESIAKSKVIAKEEVRAPTFEEYTSEEDTAEMYAKAKAEIELEEKGASGNSQKGHVTRTTLNVSDGHNDTEMDDMNDKIDMNKKLKDVRKGKNHLVIQEYMKQEMNQLHLRVGDRLKQLLPPNDEGMAYGVVTHDVIHGVIKKKRKGFYPVSHVTLVKDGIITDAHTSPPTAHSSNSGHDNNSDDVQVHKQAKKLSKAVKPRLEADDEVDVEEEHQPKEKKTMRTRIMSAVRRSKKDDDKDDTTPEEDKSPKKENVKKSLMSAIANSSLVKKMKGKKTDKDDNDKQTVKERTTTEHPMASTSGEDEISTKSPRRTMRITMNEEATIYHHGGAKIAWEEDVNNNDGQQQQPKQMSTTVTTLPTDHVISNARKRRREKARQTVAL